MQNPFLKLDDQGLLAVQQSTAKRQAENRVSGNQPMVNKSSPDDLVNVLDEMGVPQLESTPAMGITPMKKKSPQAEFSPMKETPVLKKQEQPVQNQPTVEGVQPIGKVIVNQPFGNPNGALYGYDKNGNPNINRGVDIHAEPNEIQKAPPKGNWVVEQAYAGNGYNTGWGRSVVIKNTETGETIRRSHLGSVFVNPGEIVTGKELGTTARTGNTTGFHKDIEYTNPKGQLADYLKSPYAQFEGR